MTVHYSTRTICKTPSSSEGRNVKPRTVHVCILNEEQTAFHLLTECPLIEKDPHQKIIRKITLASEAESEKELVADSVTILNCSRDSSFIQLCLEVVNNEAFKLRTEIQLVSG